MKYNPNDNNNSNSIVEGNVDKQKEIREQILKYFGKDITDSTFNDSINYSINYAISNKDNAVSIEVLLKMFDERVLYFADWKSYISLVLLSVFLTVILIDAYYMISSDKVVEQEDGEENVVSHKFIIFDSLEYLLFMCVVFLLLAVIMFFVNRYSYLYVIKKMYENDMLFKEKESSSGKDEELINKKMGLNDTEIGILMRKLYLFEAVNQDKFYLGVLSKFADNISEIPGLCGPDSKVESNSNANQNTNKNTNKNNLNSSNLNNCSVAGC